MEQELIGKRCGGSLRQRSLPPFKGPLDRAGDLPKVELLCSGACPEIVEVLHSAVRDAEDNQRLKLLGDDRLDWIRAHYRGIERQQRGERYLDRSRLHFVAKPHVDLNRDLRSIQDCRNPDPDAFVLSFLPDPFRFNCFSLNDNPIPCVTTGRGIAQ